MCECNIIENGYIEPELKEIGIKNIYYDGENVIISFIHPEVGICHFSTFFHFKYCPYCGKELKNV